MNELKEVDEDAFKWLQSHSTIIWARSMFKSDGQSDTILNNMCGSFNSRILKFKSKPIITMLECIRLCLMTRFQANREMIMKVESELCPKIRKRLYKEKLACSKWLACWAGRTGFKVKNGLESFTVDLEEKSCSCRKWDITGIPCCHAISCIFFNREDSKKYVNACYKRTAYIDCYNPIIEPINGQNMWKPSGLPPVQPPIKRRPPGRPKKKRALEPDEPRSYKKNRGVGISKQCKACGKLGHNKRTCKGEVGRNSSLPRSASQVNMTTRRAAVGSAQPSPDVIITTPPPPTGNQSNPRPKRQRKRSAITTETLNASRNAARCVVQVLCKCGAAVCCVGAAVCCAGLSGVHETTKMGFSEQKHWVGPFFLKLPLDDIELDSMRAIVSEELSSWRGDQFVVRS
ncbi:hypothetical protein SO802_026832 [Lithocarpus litseifolius]|uniref:SWIM-type domain-containing protein n=1 Tax=Lithocarpus litseifolius TaxID=425828 RepID=A0AAW2C3A5_9ROSI